MFTNNICYAGNNGSNSMAGDYLTGPPVPGSYAGNVNSALTDNAVAYNSIMALATPGDTIVMPPGYNAFNSKPVKPPDFVKVQGSGSFSALVRNYAPSGTEDIFFELGNQYSTPKDLFIMSDDRFPGGIGIGHMATSHVNCAYGPILENITVSYFNTGKFFGACKFDGVAGAPNYGARNIRLLNCLFKASYYGLLGIGLNAVSADMLNIPEAPGAGVWLIGVGDPLNPTKQTNINGILACSIQLQNTLSTTIRGNTGSSVNIDAACASCLVDLGSLSVAPTPATLQGVNNHVMANGQQWDS
jgi:hypothetical protein